MYDKRYPSVFVDEFLHPEKVTAESYAVHRNANKRWTRAADSTCLTFTVKARASNISPTRWDGAKRQLS